jgi:iron complex transport system substrate-binding protein
VLIYALAPDKLAGWSRALRPEERDYVLPAVRDLPETGRLTGRGDTASLEVMLAAEPDLILDYGSTGGTYASLADRVQTQTGIPYLLIDGRFAATVEGLRLAGEVLGVPQRAAALAGYAERVFADLDRALAEVPTDQRPRVYLARGPDGLETGLKGSINTEIIERAGAVNVADAGGDRQGIAQVQLEQILLWNPDTILTWDERFHAAVRDDPAWADVAAVRLGRVYLSPSVPFGWIDRPPSLNRLIGLRWLSSLFYPDRVAIDVGEEARIFYRLFYHVDLDEPHLRHLLGGRP